MNLKKVWNETKIEVGIEPKKKVWDGTQKRSELGPELKLELNPKKGLNWD